jgi:hypothetical protein
MFFLRSRRATDSPFSPATLAAISPAGPPPTTITSYFFICKLLPFYKHIVKTKTQAKKMPKMQKTGVRIQETEFSLCPMRYNHIAPIFHHSSTPTLQFSNPQSKIQNRNTPTLQFFPSEF